MSGITALMGMPDVYEMLLAGPDIDPEDSGRLANAQDEAEIARRETVNEFPLLHAQAVVSMVATLEAFVRDLVVGCLRYRPESLEHEEVGKLKVRLGDYVGLGDDARFEYVADLLENSLGAPMRLGVARYEELLRPFGLSGPVEEWIRKDLFEMLQVRNVLVHRRGRADRRLKEACPWLDLAEGEPVQIGHSQYARYAKAAGRYAMALFSRLPVALLRP